mmetsp:Transcript_12105/g.32451  ORF Transcript_12105/g.32451 Transcript_12105/m.32451 type:complete len:345 (+) Transcript_12105:1205-2239(+)
MPPHGRRQQLDGRLALGGIHRHRGQEARECSACSHLQGAVCQLLRHESHAESAGGLCSPKSQPHLAGRGRQLRERGAGARGDVGLRVVPTLGHTAVLRGERRHLQIQHHVGLALVLQDADEDRVQHDRTPEAVLPEVHERSHTAVKLRPGFRDQAGSLAICLPVNRDHLGPSGARLRDRGHRAGGAGEAPDVRPELGEAGDDGDLQLQLQQPIVRFVLDPQRRLGVQRRGQARGRGAVGGVAASPGLGHEIRLVDLHAILESKHVLNHDASSSKGTCLTRLCNLLLSAAQPPRRSSPHARVRSSVQRAHGPAAGADLRTPLASFTEQRTGPMRKPRKRQEGGMW